MRWATAAVALAAALALGACGVSEEDEPRFRDPADVPFGLGEAPSTTTTRPADGPAPSVACFVEGETVVTGTAAPGASLLERLRATPDPEEGGRTTSLPGPELVTTATVQGGVAEIGLGPDFTQLAPTRQRTVAAQLVCTATASPGVGQVRFTLAGVPLSVPRGDGSLSADPVTLDDYAALLTGGGGAG